jgi:hypothetical protein
MAVENFQSTQVAAMAGTTTPSLETGDSYGRLRILSFDITATAGDANSTFELVKLPAGKVTVLGLSSNLKHSAFGTGRTLDIGYSAYRQPLATSDTIADVDAFVDGADVAAAGTINLGTAPATGKISFVSTGGVTITGICLGAAVPNAATLKGYVIIVVD